MEAALAYRSFGSERRSSKSRWEENPGLTACMRTNVLKSSPAPISKMIESAISPAARTARTPSLLDSDLRLNALTVPGSPPTVLAIVSTSDFKSEELIALEAGYRTRPLDPLSLDFALFYNLYDDLRTIEPGAAFAESLRAEQRAHRQEGQSHRRRLEADGQRVV